MPDAIIIGGGPAGAAAAIGLAQGGLSVAVIERAAFPRRKVCGEFLTATNIDLLHRLGVGAAWERAAGPGIRRVALFCGMETVVAPLPGHAAFGRSLGRETLDSLLLDAARAAGAEVMQPCRATAILPAGDGHAVRVDNGESEHVLHAPVVIASHGSWQPGPLPTQPPRSGRPGDLLAFKAQLCGAKLDPELMPLLAFPGGYGGLVTTDGGRVSLSSCIRRETLLRLRRAAPGRPAAEVVRDHIAASCAAAARVLSGAEAEGGWLSAGPIRPGIRSRYRGDLFRAGNAAVEAHPIVAEGIGMGLQSGSLLAGELLREGDLSPRSRARAGRRYAATSLRLLGPRVLAAAAFAQLSLSDPGRALAAAAIGRMPGLLSGGAMLSGKRAAA